MNTSNTILLIFFLSILGIVGAVQLALYARLKEGKIIKGLRAAEDWAVIYQGKAPAVLAVEGNINIDLIPSGKFFIEGSDQPGTRISCRPMGGDSLLISTAQDRLISPHGAFQDYTDLRWLRIHANEHTLIRLRHVLALLGGSNGPGGPAWDLDLTDTQMLMGDAFGIRTSITDTVHYRAVRIDARNSNLILYRNADIEDLSVQLDERSELNDLFARIGRPVIRYAGRSQLNLTGNTLHTLRDSVDRH